MKVACDQRDDVHVVYATVTLPSLQHGTCFFHLDFSCQLRPSRHFIIMGYDAASSEQPYLTFKMVQEYVVNQINNQLKYDFDGYMI